ncbi:MAG: cytochrome c oxidase assembly factor Coa1 family protein [Tahibacter sp.]
MPHSPLLLQIAIGAVFLVVMPLAYRSFLRSDAYLLAIARLQASSQVSRELGGPLAFGWPSGEIEKLSGGGGEATLSFRVRGRNHRGKIFVEARRELHEWHLTSLALQLHGTVRRIEIRS